MQCLTKNVTYIIGLDGTKGKVLSRYRHFAQSVEQGTLANVGQTHNSHLHTVTRIAVAITLIAPVLNWPNRGEENRPHTQHQRDIHCLYLQIGFESTQHGLLHRLFLFFRRHLEGVSTDLWPAQDLATVDRCALRGCCLRRSVEHSKLTTSCRHQHRKKVNACMGHSLAAL